MEPVYLVGSRTRRPGPTIDRKVLFRKFRGDLRLTCLLVGLADSAYRDQAVLLRGDDRERGRFQKSNRADRVELPRGLAFANSTSPAEEAPRSISKRYCRERPRPVQRPTGRPRSRARDPSGLRARRPPTARARPLWRWPGPPLRTRLPATRSAPGGGAHPVAATRPG